VKKKEKVTLTFARYADQVLPYKTEMPVTDHALCGPWRRSDKGTQFFACRNADSYRRSDIVFDLKTARVGLRRSTICSAAFLQVYVNRIV